MSGRKLLYHWYHLSWTAIDLLLPPSCAGCGRRGARWCLDCQTRSQEPAEPLCEKCGGATIVPNRLCSDCRNSPPHYCHLRSWRIFDGPVRRALHELKYRRNLGLAEALTPALASFVIALNWQIDLLAAVPLGHGRWRERGYNQSGLIGWPLSLALGIPFAAGAVTRIRETRTQVGLTRRERRDNVRGAFRANSGWVKGRVVLLVDDVVTTGATMSSCAEALLAAGAKDVFAITVARAPHHSGGDG